MSTSFVRAGLAAATALTVGFGVAACGDGTPLDTVAVPAPPPAAPTGSGATERPKTHKTEPVPASSGSTSGSTSGSKVSPPSLTPLTGGGTGSAGTGSADKVTRFLDDPCALLTVREAADLTGMPITRADEDEELSDTGSRDSGAFCDYVDASGSSLLTVMMSSSRKSYTAADAATSSLNDDDKTTPAPGVADAAFTYRSSSKNGVVWAKDLPGDRFLDADVYLDRDDKDVQPDALIAIARTMVGKL